MAVAGRTVDRDARVHQPPAGLVDIVDAVGEMSEIAAAAIALLVPIMGELHLRVLIARRGEENEGEAALLIVHAPELAETEHIEEADRFLRVGHGDHSGGNGRVSWGKEWVR